MHLRKLTTMFPVAAVLAVAVVAERSAAAEDRNQISAVTHEESGATTSITIAGSRTPTFSVYKLDKPSRVVVDIAGAELGASVRGAQDASQAMAISTWAVNQVAAYELDDGGELVRIVVTLARPGRYDVKALDGAVRVLVTARDTPPPRPDARAIEAAEQAAARARKDGESAKAAQARAEREAAKAQERARDLEAQAAAARTALEAAQASAAQAKGQSEEARAAAARAVAEAKAEVERTRKAAEDARAQRERMEREVADARAEAAARAQEASAARRDADTARAQAKAAEQAAARDQQAAQAAQAQAKAAEQAAARDQQAAQTARAQAEAAEQAAARDRQAAQAAQAKAKAAEQAAARDQQAAHDAHAQAKAAEQAAARDKQAAQDAQAKAARDKQEAEQARAEAARLAREANAARDAAAADRRSAETLRAEAQAMFDDARERQATADATARRARESEQAAKAAQAKAERTQQEARATEKKATAERKAAQAALAAAEQARAAGDRDAERKVADAEARLARAESARSAAEQDRKHAETAATEARAAADQREQEAVAAAAAQKAAERDRKAAQAAADEAQDRAARAERLRAEELDAAHKAARAREAADEARRAKAGDEQVAARKAEADRLEASAARARAARQDEERQLAEVVAARRTEEAELARVRAARADAEAAAAAARRDAEAARQEAAKARAAAAQPAPAAQPATPAVKVRDVTFQQDGDEARVLVELTGEVVSQVRTTGRRAELVLRGAELPDRLQRTLDVSKFEGAVRAVSSYRDEKDPTKVHVVVELASDATPRLEQVGSTLRWNFAAAPVAAAQPRVKAQNLPAPVVGGYGASSGPVTSKSVAQVGGRRKVYRGPVINLDFKDADLHNLLRFLANIGRVSIVVPDDIKATVTVRLQKVPWDQALEVILSSKGLWYRKEGSLYRVAPRKQLDEEDEAEAERIRAAVQAEAPDAEVFTLNYASAQDTAAKLEPLLSPKGKIEVDPRTNSLIINDIRAHRRRIVELAGRLDTQTPQIMIEARIVEARSTYTRELGIQWGGRASASQAGGNATGLIFPNSIGIAGGAEDRQTQAGGVATPSDFAVNLPAAVGTGAGGAIGMSLGSVGGNFNLNLRLSAAEDTGSVRIISSPKITVLNNTQATISQGVSIPISIVSAQGTSTTFVPADLSLEVTPYVSQRDCSIAMDINVTKNEPDFVNTGARGDPTILRKEARTKILVADGETTVMGGITTRNTGLSYTKVPLLGDLPVVGWLFKSRRENDERTELLVFITPRITNKAFLRCE